MLRITASQMQLFGDKMRRHFEDNAVALLRADYPKTTASHPDEKLRHFVRFGAERAARHDIVAVTDVERWLRLMMRLGPSFDEDPELAHIAYILSKRDVDSQFRLEEVEILASRLGQARE